MNWLIELGQGVWFRWRELDLGYRTAALAYYQLFAIIPLLALLMIVSGYVSNDQQISAQLIDFLSKTFDPELSNRLIQTVQSFELQSRAVSYSITSVVVFLYAITGYFSRLHKSVKIVVGKVQESVLSTGEKARYRLIGLVYFLVLFLAITIIAGATLFVEYYSNLLAFQGLGYANEWGIVINAVLSFMIISGVMYTFYHYLAGNNVSRSAIILVSAIVSFIYVSIGSLLGYMLQLSPTFSGYGSIGALLAIMLWMFLVNATVLSGASAIAEIELAERLTK